MAYTYLSIIKSMLGISGTFHDEALNGYIAEVIEYLVASGVSREAAESERVYGLIARGVSDLWNLGSGNASLSPYFKQRVIQLAYQNKNTSINPPPETGVTEVEEITKEEIERILEE